MQNFTSQLIPITPEIQQYNSIRLKFNKLAWNACNTFEEDYEKNFSNIDDLYESCEALFANEYLSPTIDEAIKILITLGIHDISPSLFFEKYLPSHDDWTENFDNIKDKYLTLVLGTEELNAYRAERREGRGRWIGGGFGIGGALQGAAQAAAINAVSGIAHGAWNLSAKAVSAIGNKIKKDNLFASEETKETLKNGVYLGVNSVFYALIDAANDRKANSIPILENETNTSKAERIIENAQHGRIPNSDLKKILQEAIKLNPYNEDTYNLWIKNFNDDDGSVTKLANFFGIITEQEQAEAESKTFNGIVYETKQQAASARLDLENRTHKNIAYETTEQAEFERNKKRVGIPLGIGIFLAPYVFSWFTLRKGYSTTSRIVAISWAAIMILPQIFR